LWRIELVIGLGSGELLEQDRAWPVGNPLCDRVAGCVVKYVIVIGHGWRKDIILFVKGGGIQQRFKWEVEMERWRWSTSEGEELERKLHDYRRGWKMISSKPVHRWDCQEVST